MRDKILIVDDEKMLTDLLADHLRERYFEREIRIRGKAIKEGRST